MTTTTETPLETRAPDAAEPNQATPVEGEDAGPAAVTSVWRPTNLTTAELLKEIAHQAEQLVIKQVALAKAELLADLRAEASMAGGVGLGFEIGGLAVNALLVAVILGLTHWMRGWVAALVVTGFLLLVAVVVAAAGWERRVRVPLAKTRKTLKDDVKWTKERLA
jgi:hypothetical protein